MLTSAVLEGNLPKPLSSLEDLAALDLHRDLGERARGRACDYLGASGRVEDRAVARARELATPVGHPAALVGADRRVRHEVPALQVDQDGGIARIPELEGAPRRNLGLARDSRLARLGTAAGRGLRAATGVPASGVPASGTSAAAVVAAPAGVPATRVSSSAGAAGSSSAGDQ